MLAPSHCSASAARRRCGQVGVFFRGRYWHVGPWLAHRASALPENYQLKTSSDTRKKTALGNMVSPLLGRDLGYAIASAWSSAGLEPRPITNAPVLHSICSQKCGKRRRAPVPSFPRQGAGGAVLVFNDATTGSWHSVRGRRWKFTAPPVLLDDLCEQALSRGDLKLLGLGREYDLRRVVADERLSDYQRSAARQQLVDLGCSAVPDCAKLTPRQWAQTQPQAVEPIEVSCSDLQAIVPGLTDTMRWLAGATRDAQRREACKGAGALALEPLMSAQEASAHEAHEAPAQEGSARTGSSRAQRMPPNNAATVSIVSTILRHHIYRGASPGSLFNVYVRVQFSDGSSTRDYISAEPLAGTTALRKYVLSAKGKVVAKYVPPHGVPAHGAPNMPATSKPTETWVACDLCGKWRRIGLKAENQLPTDREWRCSDNPDRRFSWCEMAQELSDTEIDRQLGMEVGMHRTICLRLRGVGKSGHASSRTMIGTTFRFETASHGAF